MWNKKTHEQYVKEVFEINPNIEVLGEYVNASTKILHRCLIDMYEWNVKPSHILNGHGCPKCSGTIKKDTKQYIEEVKMINPSIEIIGEYVNNKTKILHKCKKCGYEWSTKPSHILDGHGCPRCGGSLQKTHEEYVSEVSQINPNIEVVGRYINSSQKILYKCKIDGCEWSTYPHVILKGHGCPKCFAISISKKFKNSHEQYIKKIASVNPNIEAVGEYMGSHIKILHRCKVDGYEWYASPSNIIQGYGCPKCSKTARPTQQEYINKVSMINDNIEVLGEYKNVASKIVHKCKKCGYEWDVPPNRILAGYGCPRCKSSHGESQIDKYLTENNINYIIQHKFDDCRNKRALPFDFYLPDYNACVEYDGKQHYESVEWFGGEESLLYVQQNDAIKTQYCKDNNIILLRIKYDQDVEKILNEFFKTIKPFEEVAL